MAYTVNRVLCITDHQVSIFHYDIAESRRIDDIICERIFLFLVLLSTRHLDVVFADLRAFAAIVVVVAKLVFRLDVDDDDIAVAAVVVVASRSNAHQVFGRVQSEFTLRRVDNSL